MTITGTMGALDAKTEREILMIALMHACDHPEDFCRTCDQHVGDHCGHCGGCPDGHCPRCAACMPYGECDECGHPESLQDPRAV